VAIAALLGAEEFGFTAPLVASGCYDAGVSLEYMSSRYCNTRS
jgi:glutamate synthase domain-containing protein 2